MAENIIAAEDLLERMQDPGEDPEARSGILKKIGQNISNSSIFGVNKKQKIDPQLKTAERSRLKNKMDIIVESWFKLKKKYVPDEKGKTVVSKTADDAKDMSEQLSKDGKKQGKGLLGWLMGLLGMFGLGKTGAGRALFKVIGGWLWKSLKWIGGKVWGFIKWGLKKGWGILKGIFAGVWKSIKWLGRGAWNLLKGAISGIGKFFSGLWTGFKNLPVWKAFSGAIGKGVEAVKGIFTSAKNTIVNALKSVGNFFKSALQKIPGIGKIFPALAKTAAQTGGAATSALAQQAAKPSLLSRGWNLLKKGGSAVVKGGGDLLKKGGSLIKSGAQATLKGAKYAGGQVVKGVKAVGKLAGAPLKAAWNAAKNYMTKGGGKKILRGVLSKIPFIGAAIEGAFAAYDINKASKQGPEKTQADLEEQIGKRVVEGLGGVVVGAALAAALTAVGGPVLGFLGFMAGDWVGRKIGGMLADNMGARPVGQMMMSFFPSLVANREAALAAGDKAALQKKTPESQIVEAQDFVWRSGARSPISFTSKDDILGMKKGGAISQLLTMGLPAGNIEMAAKLAKLQISTIELSNKYLHQLVQLTQVLVKKPVGGGGNTTIPNVPLPQNNDMQGDMSGPVYADNRSNYFSSPYNMHAPGVAT